MGTNYLIDINIVSKLFQGNLPEDSLKFLSQLQTSQLHISVINRIELSSWKEAENELLQNLISFFNDIREFEINEEIVTQTINIRKKVSIKLPDALIAATAIVHNLILLSDNEKDFKKVPRLKYLNPNKKLILRFYT